MVRWHVEIVDFVHFVRTRQLLWDANVPVFVGRLTMSINAMQRVVLVIPANSLVGPLVTNTVEMATTIARAINVPLLLLVARRYADYLEEALVQEEEHPYEIVVERIEVEPVVSRLSADDLVVITTTGSPHFFRSSVGYIPDQLVARTNSSIVLIHYPS